VAAAAARLRLRHVVLTSVARDDLDDGGAAHFRATVEEIRRRLPETRVEVLIPDFKGDERALATILETRPDVLNHNIESVPRLFPRVRPQGSYERSLELLRAARRASPGQVTKSGFMVGLGEADDEIETLLRDLRSACVDIVTMGQYLRPTRQHLPVERYFPPEEFRRLAAAARAMGFPTVYSGVFVRSSYNAQEVLEGARGAASA